MEGRGIIREFEVSLGSGIAILVIEDSEGKIKRIPCDCNMTIKALEDCFGEDAFEEDSYIGKQIVYVLDDAGRLESFIDAESLGDG